MIESREIFLLSKNYYQVPKKLALRQVHSYDQSGATNEAKGTVVEPGLSFHHLLGGHLCKGREGWTAAV